MKQQNIIERTNEVNTFIETNPNKNKIVIVGTGAFGTAIGNMLVAKNEFVILYGVDQKEIDDINVNHKNTRYYNVPLSPNLMALSDPEKAFKDAFLILLALPSNVMDTVLKKVIVPNMTRPAYFINLSKGFDFLNVRLLNELINDIVPKKYNLGILKLSGPSFADDLIRKTFTIFSLAADNIALAEKLKPFLETDFTRIYPTEDLNGIELLSVIKNPFALLMGIVCGLNYRQNTQAIFFVEMIREMRILVESFGANPDIIFSPAGIGDFYLTATSKKSRNFSVGYKIGRADKVNKKTLSLFSTVEGLRTIEILSTITKKKKINLKLLELLYNINYKNQKPSVEIDYFLKNDLNLNKNETNDFH